jgi:hypothetical protein
MKFKVVIALVLDLVLLFTMAIPVLAEGNGPQYNQGQACKAAYDHGEMDDVVHEWQEDAAELDMPVGQLFLESKRDSGQIPGWVKNGGPNPK